MMKEVVIEDLTVPMKMLKKCGIQYIQTTKQAYYVEILKWLRKAVRRKRPKLWPNDWIIHHDNATAHKALSSSFWPKNGLLKWNTHHSPNLPPNDFCFQK
jgi:hypothetical protein